MDNKKNKIFTKEYINMNTSIYATDNEITIKLWEAWNLRLTAALNPFIVQPTSITQAEGNKRERSCTAYSVAVVLVTTLSQVIVLSVVTSRGNS